MRVLVAGLGNLLRADDGFGVAVARRLLEEPRPDGVSVLELGIGGIHLVQELLGDGGVDALVVVDAVDLGRPPGTVVVLHADVPDVSALPLWERRDRLADMHYATPDRALELARALGALPDRTWVVGCQPAEVDRLGVDLSPAVREAVAVAAEEVRRLVSDLGIPWG